MGKRLSVVTVTYNSADVLPGFLDSMAEGLAGIDDFEIVVADNASSDDSAAIAERHRIGPRVIRTGRNGGYSAGINAAVASIEREADLLILNPDIRLMPGSALKLVNGLKDPTVGIAAPRILTEGGELVFSLRREPSILTALSDAMLGGRLGARLGTGELLADEAIYRSGGSVEWASGAALAVSSAARQHAGNWDESFFLYSEETEYCRRVRSCGYQVRHIPGATVKHIGGEYLVNPQLYGLLTANRIRYYRRNHGAGATALFRLAIACGEAARAVLGTRHSSGLRAALAPAKWIPASPRAAKT